MKGYIVFNGNIKFETDFINKFKDMILSSNHIDPKVRDSKKVLLITAAWQKREFKENHIKQGLYNIGIQPNFKGGFDQHIQNLSVYHDFNIFKKEVPSIHDFYHSKQKVIQKVKEFYREKNSGLISILQKQLSILKGTFRGVTLAKVLSYDVSSKAKSINSINQWELLYHYACQDIQSTISKLRENDEQMIGVCKEIDDYFFTNSNIMENKIYIQLRNQLKERILSSNTIFIFGGNVAVLYNRLNFFKLKDTFVEALNRGTNFYTVSAGSLSLCDNIVVFDDNSNEWTNSNNLFDFELFDVGFGLVKKIQIFPHCKDYIHMDDPDTITYTAERFNRSMCVGLDQESFLLLQTYEENGKEYEKFTSVGNTEGLYIFNKDGSIKTTKFGEELVLEGTKAFERAYGV
ncbi:MAG: Type 1 glutamine amidotransferase-like domain-containing protein [Candidatus Sericytochromatia bacterium]